MFKSRRTVRVAVSLALATIALTAESLINDRTGAGSLRTEIVDGREVVEGEVIVRYKADAGPVGRERAEFHARSEMSQFVGRQGAQRLVSRQLSTSEMIAALRANPDVEYVEPNYVIRANAVPNDPSFGNLWGLLNTGQRVDGQDGTPGADIGATAAWDVTTGSRANIVAILDTGIDVAHPDLTANIFSAPRQFTVTISGAQLTCPAGTRGFNAMLNTCNAVDDNGHGTHVAGIIGAIGNNNLGVTGVNWIANLLPLKVLDSTGTGTTTDAIEAIEFAIGIKNTLGVDANVRVLNASWGGGVFSQALSDAIQAANTNDMLFIASAGSGGNSNDITPHYPASLSIANVISVGAVDNTGELAPYSNFGASSVDLAAPGASTLSTMPGTYNSLGGTSIAAPFVSGAAALVLSACPSDTATLKALLLSSVEPVASLAGKTATGGRLNVGNALQQCGPAGGSPMLSIGDVNVNEGESGTSTATFTVRLSPVNETDTVTVNYATGGGTATAGTDYVAASGTLTFPPSTASRTISVTINGDATMEPNETFMVTLSGAVNAAISDTQGVGLIANDDTPPGPAVTINTPTVAPGGVISFTVTNGPANRTDWVALVPAAGADTDKIAWSYLNGTKTAPAAGVANATLQFTAPMTTGSYDVRLFANDGYSRLARSAAMTVANGPTLSINDVNVTEGNSGTATATFTVTVSPVSASQTITVNYATANGSASAGSDYVAASGTVTFAPTVATQTLSVTVNGDIGNEPNETFFINLSGAVNAAIGDAQGAGTITNDDGPAGPSIAINTATVAPGGVISFTVSNGPANPTDWVALVPAAGADGAKIAWSYLNGTKTPPAAGVANATLQFTAPMTTGAYDIRLFVNDGYTRIARSGPVSVATGPSLTINDVNVTEGNSGTVTATFTVTASPVNASQTITVNYATANGSATAGTDYAAANGTLTFAPNVATQTISVTVNGDAGNEPNETFFVNLSGAANAAISDAQGVGTITNDDGPTGPSIALNTPTVAPGGVISFTVSNGPANARDWVALVPAAGADGDKIAWSYLNGTKTPPAAGVANATLQFTAPMTTGAYDIRLFVNDGYTRIARSGPVSVATGPTLTINDVSVTEGNSGTTTATFTVTLSPVNGSQSVTVDYATANGSAAAGSDAVAVNGTLTFAPSVATQTISVTVNGDTVVEPNETFAVNLSNAVNAAIGRAQGVGTIINDDGPAGPSITINTPNVAPGGVISVTVNDGPGNPADWIGLFPAGADDSGKVAWVYLNGTKTAPTTGMRNATVQLTAPSIAGTYNIRLFANDGYGKLATSANITVAP